MKKLFDSDWPRTVQFMCNSTAKSVTPVVHNTHRNFRYYDWMRDNGPMISSKMMRKILRRNYEESFIE